MFWYFLGILWEENFVVSNMYIRFVDYDILYIVCVENDKGKFFVYIFNNFKV